MLDRVSGRPASLADLRDSRGFVTGRFVIDPRDGFALNGFSLPQRWIVMADRTGRWAVSSTEARVEGDLAGPALPGEVTRSALSDLTRQRPFTATGLLDIVPLLPRSDVDESDDPRDQHIKDALPSLRAVVERPRSRLRRSHDVVPIGKVRRVTSRSTIHLAAHSELWGRKSLTRVEPSRMMSELPETDFEIYENRVVAEAIHRAAALLDSRLRRVGDVRDYLHHLDLVVNQLSGRPWRVTTRLSTQLVDLPLEDRHHQFRTAHDSLRELRARIGVLLDSPFSRDVRRAGTLEHGLAWTNLLLDDARYRTSANLIDVLGREDVETEEQHLVTTDQIALRFVAFCMILVAQALDDLGWEPQGDPAIRRGCEVHYSHADGLLNLRWDEDDTLCLRRDDLSPSRSVRLIPIIQPLQSIPDSGAAAHLLSHLDRAATHRPEDKVVVLYPRDGRASATWPTWLVDRFASLDHEQSRQARLGLLPVGPLETDSVERVARLLGWFTRGWLYTTVYPPQFTADRIAIDQIVPASGGALRRTAAQGGVALVRPMTASENHEVDAALGQIERHEATQVQQRTTSGATARSALNRATASLARLTSCPGCGQRVLQQDFQPRADETFWCSCRSCHFEWGLRTCGGCGGRVPVLAPSGLATDPSRSGGEWLDHHVGSEAAAAPCPNDPHDVLCPSCRTCPNSTGPEPCTSCRALREEIGHG